jgi:hypothetical protein
MTEPTPETTPAQPRRRRVNPDRAPFKDLPMVKADETGETDYGIHVIRGEFDPYKLTVEQARTIRRMPTDEFVVFTTSYGAHQIAWRGQYLDRDLDLTTIGDLPDEHRVLDALGYHPTQATDLAEVASDLRHHAWLATSLAEKYQRLVDEGWKFNDDPKTSPWGDIVNTGGLAVPGDFED